ncbi:hypothetical protein [Salmonella enterica]|nr:hypothetical protein [Salmonella enterica]
MPDAQQNGKKQASVVRKIERVKEILMQGFMYDEIKNALSVIDFVE